MKSWKKEEHKNKVNNNFFKKQTSSKKKKSWQKYIITLYYIKYTEKTRKTEIHKNFAMKKMKIKKK